MTMKIGFDAKRAAQNRTGLGNYSRFVIRILSQQEAENEYHLYVHNPKRTPFLADIPTLGRLKLHFPKTWLWLKLRILWRLWGMTDDMKHDGIDIYHGLSNELPMNIKGSGIKSVVTIHDLIFRRYPQYYNSIDRQLYDFKFYHACMEADHIIAVSEFTKREIMHYYGIDAERISVVYQGCDPAFGQEVAAEKLKDVSLRYNLPERYLLYVGTIEERKNLLLAIKALARIDERIKLVAVGRKTKYMDRLKEYIRQSGKQGLDEDVIFLHNVPFADLPAIYHLATTFVYPSRIEGFGIPMLEAISAGIPAIGCTGSCLEEAGGEGSIYVAPDDDAAMAEAILNTFHNNELRERMVAMGREYALKFSDKRLCQDVMRVYTNLQRVAN